MLFYFCLVLVLVYSILILFYVLFFVKEIGLLEKEKYWVDNMEGNLFKYQQNINVCYLFYIIVSLFVFFFFCAFNLEFYRFSEYISFIIPLYFFCAILLTYLLL